MDILTLFITGLFAGGLTCLAVQGGLLASSIAQQEEDKLEEDAQKTGHLLPIVSFLTARLVAYTLLGLLLGALGSVLQISLFTRALLQVAVSIFMIGTALNLLQLHPVFRYFVIQPPHFFTRLIKNQSKSKSIFGPALLGAFTVFIPCGATQAVMAYALTTGSALAGAVSLFAFILGTSPLFFVLGYAARRLGSAASPVLNKIAAVAIILIAIYNLTGAVALAGFPFAKSTPAEQQPATAVTQATIYFTRTGYVTEPASITAQSGSTLKLKLVNQDGAGCIQAFTIPKFGIQRTVPVGSSTEIALTMPRASESIPFMCSMGMYQGSITVL